MMVGCYPQSLDFMPAEAGIIKSYKSYQIKE